MGCRRATLGPVGVVCRIHQIEEAAGDSDSLLVFDPVALDVSVGIGALVLPLGMSGNVMVVAYHD